MNDLTEYFSDKDKIIALEARITLLQKKLDSAYSGKCHYKTLYIELKDDKKPSRKSRALKLIGELKGVGKVMESIRHIAKECFLSEARIAQLWYEH